MQAIALQPSRRQAKIIPFPAPQARNDNRPSRDTRWLWWIAAVLAISIGGEMWSSQLSSQSAKPGISSPRPASPANTQTSKPNLVVARN